MDNLDHLSMSHNLLDHLGKNYFTGLPMLSTLYIENNKITAVHTEAFSGLEGKLKQKILHDYKNKIRFPDNWNLLCLCHYFQHTWLRFPWLEISSESFLQKPSNQFMNWQLCTWMITRSVYWTSVPLKALANISNSFGFKITSKQFRYN